MPHVTDQGASVPPTLPPGRYGSPRTTPRWVIALLGAVGLLALLPVLLSAADQATPDTRATVTGWTAETDNQVRATVDVTKPAGRAATCTVQARNFYSDVVGSAQVTLAASAESGAVTRTFPTSEKAVVVEVTECREGSGD